MTLAELQRIKQWQVDHRGDHPVEYHFWDVILAIWLVGWMGWIPVLVTGAIWAAPLCVLAASAPALYVRWRVRAHATGRLRCDWLPPG